MMNPTDTSLKSPLGRLLKIGFAEGLSFLILLFIAMPLKYVFDILPPVRIIGMLHGVLFILYSLALAQASLSYRWKIKTAIIAFLLSFLPFGTFYLKRFLEKQEGA